MTEMKWPRMLPLEASTAGADKIGPALLLCVSPAEAVVLKDVYSFEGAAVEGSSMRAIQFLYSAN